MRPSVWFLVPAHGRVEITRVCLQHLARVCSDLAGYGVDASAVVIASDDNLDTAARLGFGTIDRENSPLGRKWNDGYELAGRYGVDYVVPLGSDDWVRPEWVLQQLERDGEFRCSRESSVVREDGRRLATLEIAYERRGGPAMGDGIRMIPTGLLKPLGYRPATEDRERGIDTSVWLNVSAMLGRNPRVTYAEDGPLQIVDWKSRDTQLNTYEGCLKYATGEFDPWDVLPGVYPAESIAEMASVYGIHDRVAA